MSNVKLSKDSQERLETRHPDLIKVMELAFERMPFDIMVLSSTVRTIEDQKRFVAEGKSWTMKSKHLDGTAIDIAPYPINWADTGRFIEMANVVFQAAEDLGIPVKWGGTWSTTTEKWYENKKFDGPHFELIRG